MASTITTDAEFCYQLPESLEFSENIRDTNIIPTIADIPITILQCNMEETWNNFEIPFNKLPNNLFEMCEKGLETNSLLKKLCISQ